MSELAPICKQEFSSRYRIDIVYMKNSVDALYVKCTTIDMPALSKLTSYIKCNHWNFSSRPRAGGEFEFIDKGSIISMSAKNVALQYILRGHFFLGRLGGMWTRVDLLESESQQKEELMPW